MHVYYCSTGKFLYLFTSVRQTCRSSVQCINVEAMATLQANLQVVATSSDGRAKCPYDPTSIYVFAYASKYSCPLDAVVLLRSIMVAHYSASKSEDHYVRRVVAAACLLPLLYCYNFIVYIA